MRGKTNAAQLEGCFLHVVVLSNDILRVLHIGRGNMWITHLFVTGDHVKYEGKGRVIEG